MRGLIVFTIAIVQINGQHGGMGSDMGGGMGGGMRSGGMSGVGSGLGNYPPSPSPVGNGMGSGMGNGMGSNMGVPWCCPMKNIYGSPNGMDGIYTNVGKLPWNQLPYRCNSPCVYERKNSYNGMQFCFADSLTTQAECDESYDDGEEPVDMGTGGGYGSEDPVDMGSGSGSGGIGSSGMGSGSMGSGSGQSSGSGSGSGQGSGSGSGSGSGISTCQPRQLMDDCNANCVGVARPPDTQIFSSVQTGPDTYRTSWTLNVGDKGDSITLNCPNQPLDATTTCTDGAWTIPQPIQKLCGPSQGSGSGSGSGSESGSGSGNGSGSGSGNGSGSGSGNGSGSGSGSGVMGMGDHGGSSSGGMGDHGGSSSGGMGDHGSSGDGGN